MPRKKGKNHKSAQREMPASSIVFRGPIRAIAAARDETLSTQELTLVANLTASAGGVITPVWSNPNAASEWSQLAALYEEYRVVGIRALYIPFYPHWGTTSALALNQGGIVWYPLRNGSVLATSAATAFAFAGAIPHAITDRAVVENRMSSTNESDFTNTSAPVGLFAVAAYGTGFTASTSYGTMFITWLVQFRSRF